MMKFIVFLFLLLSLGCGGGGDAGPHEKLEELGESLPNVVLINVNEGLDHQLYARYTIFKTITFALSAVKNKNIFPERVNLLVGEGIYNESSGEIFPVVLDEGVNIYGTSNVLIEKQFSNDTGEKLGVIRIKGDLILNNLSISSKSSDIGIYIESGSPHITHIKLTENSTAISIHNDSSPSIVLNILSSNVTAVEVYDLSLPIFFENTINENEVGINIFDFSRPSFGTAENLGGNIISANTTYDLCNFTNNNISAIGNYWYESTELIAVKDTCNENSKIGNTLEGNILLFSPPPENSKVFQSTNLIFLSAPEFRKIIVTDTPNFTWNSSGGEKLVALGVFSDRIEIANNSILNTDELVFYWDSGDGKGRIGSIKFDDGRRVVNGIFQTNSQVMPLIRGKSYYWAVWAWDNAGKYIISSSTEGFFTISR